MKSLSRSLTGCCFISDGKIKSNARNGLEDGFPAGGTLRECTFLNQRAREEEEEVGGVGGCIEVAKVVVEEGPSRTSTEVSHIRLTVGGRPPQRLL